MKTLIENCIQAAGSPSKLADGLGYTRATISLWRKRGDLIPSQHHRHILETSDKKGWGLTPADLVDYPHNEQN